MRTLYILHDMLVVRIPPKHFATEHARLEHASGQATYKYDERGRFAPGLRVSDDVTNQTTCLLGMLTWHAGVAIYAMWQQVIG